MATLDDLKAALHKGRRAERMVGAPADHVPITGLTYKDTTATDMWLYTHIAGVGATEEEAIADAFKSPALTKLPEGGTIMWRVPLRMERVRDFETATDEVRVYGRFCHIPRSAE